MKLELLHEEVENLRAVRAKHEEMEATYKKLIKLNKDFEAFKEEKGNMDKDIKVQSRLVNQLREELSDLRDENMSLTEENEKYLSKIIN